MRDHEAPREFYPENIRPDMKLPKGGLLVEVMGMNCTNGGVSGKAEHAILAGYGIDEIFEPREGVPMLLLAKRCGRLIAVPAKQPQGVIGPMFGGRFVYTYDARFPSGQPIHIHDRFETQEMYDLMST